MLEKLEVNLSIAFIQIYRTTQLMNQQLMGHLTYKVEPSTPILLTMSKVFSIAIGKKWHDNQHQKAKALLDQMASPPSS